MRILYVSQYFPPEMGAPAARVSELARLWAAQGHDVTVLTGFPNHPNGVVPEAYRRQFRRLTSEERYHGARVIRTWLLPAPNRKARERMANYSSFALSAGLRGLFTHKPDVIIATSPQMLVGMTGWWLAKAKRTPFVFEVRDLWPESLAASGMGRDGSILVRGLDRLASFLYGAADHVVTVTGAQRQDLIANRGLTPEKVSVVENGIDAGLFTPITKEKARSFLGLEQDRFVASFIGTIGMAHGLDTVLNAAARLQRSLPHALFMLVGDGAQREALERRAEQDGLWNVRFVEQQPRARVPYYISASDVCLVTLRESDVFKTVIPSKMLEFMACGRPVILGVDGQARTILDAGNAGVFVHPGNVNALTDAILDLERDPDRRESLGRNGREYVMKQFNREVQARRYLETLAQVVDRGRAGARARLVENPTEAAV